MGCCSLGDINIKPRFLISVVSHGHGPLLTLLLADIKKYVPTADVVVTFNIPENFDSTCWSDVNFIHNNSPRGFGENHNAALRRTAHDWLVVINPDIRLLPNTFSEIGKAILGYPEVDLFAPKVIGANGALEDSARALPTPARVLRRTASRLLGRSTSSADADLKSWYAGMFLVLRRTAFELVGGFDERFFLYGEDVALCIQLVAQNRRMHLVSNAVVIHDARRATLRSFRHFRWHCASLIRLWGLRDFYTHEKRYRALDGTSNLGIK